MLYIRHPVYVGGLQRISTMKNASLGQLEIFETVAPNLSFSRAADELHLTQPAVSTWVKQLEEHAGLALFEQLGRKIYLASARSEMFPYALSILTFRRSRTQFEANFVASPATERRALRRRGA
jgi:DNA-binding transcriptional LysR family regulator